MKTSKYLTLAVFMLIFASCMNLDKQIYSDSTLTATPTTYDSTLTDTIPTIVLSVPQEDWATLKVTSEGISIKSTNLNSEYKVIPKTITVSFDDNGNIYFLKTNTSILYQEKANTSYSYLDANTVIVKAGNTAHRIAKDHNTSISELKRLNPTKNLNKISINDVIRVY
jgi:LysM repeat protein